MGEFIFLLNLQFEGKKIARRCLSFMTDTKHITGEESNINDDDPDGGRIQGLGDTGIKRPEDNEQSRLTASLGLVNKAKDSKHCDSDGLPAKKVEKGSKLLSLVSSNDDDGENIALHIKKLEIR